MCDPVNALKPMRAPPAFKHLKGSSGQENTKILLIISSVHLVQRAMILGSGELTLTMGAAMHLGLMREG